MQNRPFQTPAVALAIHLCVTIIFICAPPAGDAFNFVVKLSSYPTTVMLTATTFALIKLRYSRSADYEPTYSTPWVIILFYLAGSLVCEYPFVLVRQPPNLCIVSGRNALHSAKRQQRDIRLTVLSVSIGGPGHLGVGFSILYFTLFGAAMGVPVRAASGHGGACRWISGKTV